ncbi:hypothetical protein GIB67_001105 [Kingdonia uniflora]|uniref:Uncharacterized protein n=1 Tax=Kingdonia uniflora TaxID=39325 RepID=A0A7J7MGC7_9MAGN|nr:hypothetical protein GIB67_001105 [Kingdonia uniflora]
MMRTRKKIRVAARAGKKTNQSGNKIPEWVINFSNCKEGTEYDLGRAWTIYRVPKNMLEVHRSAYIPKIISIGPFHCCDPSLHVMEEHKRRYLLRLLGLTSQDNRILQPCSPKESYPRLESLAAAMKLLERKTRECYYETFDIDSDDFVQMMAIDGCFIIELLRLYHKVNVDDPIFTTRWMLRMLQRDLLMLENQLPFFVLQELFNLTRSGKEPCLIELSLKFFDPLLPREKKLLNVNPLIEYDHLLDLFRTTFLSFIQQMKPTTGWRSIARPQRSGSRSLPLVEERQLIHSVTELQEAGVKFKKRNGHDLLDIEFEKGVLKIPPLYIDDNTVPLLLNFVAYEQCDEEAEPYFTDHLMFFDSLLNSVTDVEILHKNGIVNHVLGSDKDVVNLFNKLGREIVYDVEDCHLAAQMKGVNDYYKSYYKKKCHLWRTNLIRDFFSSPWTFLSLLAAIVLLLLTIAQTVMAFFSYLCPP